MLQKSATMDEGGMEMAAVEDVSRKKGLPALVSHQCAHWTLFVGTECSNQEGGRCVTMATTSMVMAVLWHAR